MSAKTISQACYQEVLYYMKLNKPYYTTCLSSTFTKEYTEPTSVLWFDDIEYQEGAIGHTCLENYSRLLLPF